MINVVIVAQVFGIGTCKAKLSVESDKDIDDIHRIIGLANFPHGIMVTLERESSLDADQPTIVQQREQGFGFVSLPVELG